MILIIQFFANKVKCFNGKSLTKWLKINILLEGEQK